MEAQNAESFYLKSTKPAFLFISCFLLLGLLPLSKAKLIDDNINFTFTSFDPNGHEIMYERNAYASDNVIQLTINQKDKGLNDSVGRATYYKPLHLWDSSSGDLVLADFSTQFSFAIDSLKNSSKGDGLTFFLAPNGSKIPPQSEGGSLGLQSYDQSVHSEFVAVEFDTFHNTWDPVASDHVAIDLNSVNTSPSFANWGWSDTENGGKVDAFISYNSRTKNLSVFFLDADDFTGKNSSSLSWILDISKYLPEWVNFGFSASTGSLFEIHTIYSWNFSSTLQAAANTSNQTNPPTAAPAAATSPARLPDNPRRKSRTWLWVVLGVAGGIFALLPVLALLWFFCWRKKYESNECNTMSVNVEMEMVTAPRKFSFKELRFATSNFADEGLLGEGGFGKVYLGFLRDMNCNIAVKRITPQSQQGVKEYASEIRTVSRLRHRNLVQLIGWCHDNQELLIVYEFLPNKSLDYHLFREPCLLTWEKRYKIAMGLASALFYLQEECEQCVLHRDIKSSNVLLDLSFNAKLGDFGLARLVDHGQGSRTTIMLGTDGYVAPECLETYKAIKESDVYSFGIVALEIASGKQAISTIDKNGKKFKTKLVEWVWELYGRESIFEAADPRLSDNYDKEQMERLLLVGLACAHPNYFARPSITQAVDILGFKAQLPVMPLEMPVPTYIAAHQANIVASSASNSSHISASNRSQAQFSGASSSSETLKVRTRTPISDAK
ncbi:L-type lectin-domain containing receptor kinase IX.2-like [Durio zibethinus]|uniref:non-specific serine/threonine protein kinase n=1 Tax=Durio zibethinus TaxID=66656 RepID=A0A6P5YWC6_DURZI|nr:L-type lectin-domain containing receptor kinase IX.2-like [Durio zibethinus]